MLARGSTARIRFFDLLLLRKCQVGGVFQGGGLLFPLFRFDTGERRRHRINYRVAILFLWDLFLQRLAFQAPTFFLLLLFQ